MSEYIARTFTPYLLSSNLVCKLSCFYLNKKHLMLVDVKSATLLFTLMYLYMEKLDASYRVI